MPSPKISVKALRKYLGVRPMAIAMTADWCGHCKHLKEPWDAAHDKFKVSNPNVIVARFDADKHRNELGNIGEATHGTKVRDALGGYPTIMFFEGGGDKVASAPLRASLYRGPRDAENIIHAIGTFHA